MGSEGNELTLSISSIERSVKIFFNLGHLTLFLRKKVK